MGYRDEVEALRSRLGVTEKRVAELEEENESLRKAALEPKQITAKKSDRAERSSFRLGRIHFSRPRTYFPLLRLLVDVFLPGPPPALGQTDVVILWALHRFVLIPLWYLVVWPLHFVLYPNLALGALAATPFYAILLLLRGLRFGEPKTQKPWGWDGKAEMPPVFFTVTAGGAYGFVTVTLLANVLGLVAP